MRPTRATVLNLVTPRLRLAPVGGTAHTVKRDEGDIAANPAGGIVANFALEGESRFFHRHGCEVLSPGQGIVYDADQPFSRGFGQGLRELVLKVPRDALREVAGTGNMARPTVFDFRGALQFQSDGSAPGGALAAAVGGALTGQPVEWDALEDRILGLLGHLVGAERRAAGHLAAAEALIAAHHSDTSLSAQRIAAAIGISERHLSRVFADSGRSVPQAILEARLDSARRLLGDPAHRDASMAQVAARAGFATQAQFSRSFRSRFVETPLRHRRELAAAD